MARYCFKLLLFRVTTVSFALGVLSVSGHGSEREDKPILAPLYTCFDGYTLVESGKRCVQFLDEAPTPMCPPVKSGEAGSVDEAGCRVQIPVLKRCDDGYVLSENGDCSYISYSTVKYFCPAGYTDDGTNCVQKLPGEIVTFCSEGTRVGEQCVKTHTVSAETVVTCPDGAVLEDGTCWHIADTYDCTGEFGCQEDGHTSRGQRGWTAARHLHASHLKSVGLAESTTWPTKEVVAATSIAVKQPETAEVLVPVTAPRPFKVRIVSQMCQKLLEVPTVTLQQCPDGYIARETPAKQSLRDENTERPSSECYVEEYFPLESECVETGGPSETCPSKISYTPKQARCADGSLGKKGQCEERVVVPGTEYCPPSFVREGTFCVGYLDAPLECAPGLTMNSSGRCVGTREHAPVLVVPSTAAAPTVIDSTPTVSDGVAEVVAEGSSPSGSSIIKYSSAETPGMLRGGGKPPGLHKVKTFKSVKALAVDRQ